jgi:hypothetical protein
MAVRAQCERCQALDRQIENFKRMHRAATDDLALSLLLEAIADLEAEKASLHREEEPKK